MTAETCEIVAPIKSWLGFKTTVTLSSALNPDAVRQRLDETFPFFHVPPDWPGSFRQLPRVYSGTMRRDSFRLYGPCRRSMNAGPFPDLCVCGTIEHTRQGSLIRLNIYPLAGMFFSSIVMTVILYFVTIILKALWKEPFDPFGLLLLFPFVPVIGVVIFGILGYLTRSRKELTLLLAYLQGVFSEIPPIKSPRKEAGSAAAETPPEAPVVDAVRRSERAGFRAAMWLVGGFGAVFAFACGVSVLLIFVVPAWQRFQQLRRMVETRCEVLDSRINEQQYAEEKTVRRGSRHERVPTGRMITHYQPDLLVRHEVDGAALETWTSRSVHAVTFQQRGPAEKAIARFRKGGQYPCWYDPLDPRVVVLDKTAGGLGVVGLIIFGLIAFAGVAALPIIMIVVAVIAYRANRRRAT